MLTWIIVIILITIWVLAFTYLFHSILSKIKRKGIYVPFIPIDKKGLDLVLKYVSFDDCNIVYDVGSGWGTAIHYFARKFSDKKFIGIEINPVLHLIALIRMKLDGSRNIEFYKRDAATFGYKDADLIFVFMLPGFLQKVLLPILEENLRKGARVVSYVFPLKSSQFNIKEIELPQRGWRNKMYIAIKK